MRDDIRITEILSTIKKIEDSNLSVKGYFDQKIVPFTRPQYYIYCKILRQYGEEGLHDKRTAGNNTKLTQRIKDYIIPIVTENRSIPSSQLQIKIQNKFGINISISNLNNFRASASLTRLPPPPKKECEQQKSGGGEILTALSFFTHIIDTYTQAIIERMYEVQDLNRFAHPPYTLHFHLLN